MITIEVDAFSILERRLNRIEGLLLDIKEPNTSNTKTSKVRKNLGGQPAKAQIQPHKHKGG